jgi:hypothetical protein
MKVCLILDFVPKLSDNPVLWHTESQGEPNFKFVHRAIPPCGFRDATTEDSPILSSGSTPFSWGLSRNFGTMPDFK